MGWSWGGAAQGALMGYGISDAIMGSEFGQRIGDYLNKKALSHQLKSRGSLGDIYGQDKQPFRFEGMGDYLKEDKPSQFSFDYSYEGKYPEFELLGK